MRYRLLIPALLLRASPVLADETRIAPPYKDAPEMRAQPGQPKGRLQSFIMTSAESHIYPGVRQLDNAVTQRRDAFGNRLAAPIDQTSEAAPWRREILVYIPAGYK